MNKLKCLQSGTDIRGIAIAYDSVPKSLSVNEVKAIVKGFLIWLKKYENDNLSVAIGTDPRLSGKELKDACIDVFKEYGVTVYDCGLATTPAMFMTTIMDKYNCTGSIMITASHLPYYYNGMKFFTKNGGCEKDNISEILELTTKDIRKCSEGEVYSVDLLEEYSKILIDKIKNGTKAKNEKPLEGLKIIVDAGNGAGVFFAEKVLKPLGANTEGSQFLNPDGNFPNHIPNPENKEAMGSITKAVLDNKADLGIIFDTDVDRAAIVGKDGSQINKNALIAMISAIILEEHPGSTIVTDSITSDGLRKFIESLGGHQHRFKRGYKNVINEAVRLNEEAIETHLAIETSGHAAIKENYFLDDGAYLISKLLVKMADMKIENKDLLDLIKDLEYPKESESFRLPIDRDDYKEYGEKIIEDIKDYANKDESFILPKNNYEGIKICFEKNDGDGWMLIRLSLHEPLIAINIESNENNGVNRIKFKLVKLLDKYEHLDLSLLK